MVKSIKVISISALTQKSKFGKNKYFGYKRFKYLGIIKLLSNKKLAGYGETLVGVYSPKLFKINLEYISSFIKNKNPIEILNILKNLKKNKFFFDNGILKSIISGIEIAIIDLLAQINNQNHSEVMASILNLPAKVTVNKIPIYASAGSILSNYQDLKKDLFLSKRKGIEIIKCRMSIQNENKYKKKINLLSSDIEKFSIDLISNTYEKNNDIKKIYNFLNFIEKKKPEWIEEILQTNFLYKFIDIRKKFKLKFSYGENFNSEIDFFNLINFYSFDFINPDLSHISFYEIKRMSDIFLKKNKSKKVIIHCWGGAINFLFSLHYALIDPNQVKYVEYPITDSNFFDKLNSYMSIKNSSVFLNPNIKSYKEILDYDSMSFHKSSSLTFNF